MPAGCARLRGIDPPPQDAGNPLALDREQMRALGYRTVDALVDWLSDDAQPPLRSATPAEMAARLGRLDARAPAPFDDAARTLVRGRPAVREPLGAPALLRVRPVRGNVAGRARRLRRERVQRLRRLVDGVGGPDAARAAVLDWFKDWIGYPAEAGGLARQRRLGRQPDGARLRARGARRVDARRPRRLRLRPGALLARPRGAHARLPARPGARAARSTSDLRLARRRSPPRSTPTPPPDARRSSSSRTAARRTPARSTRSTSSPTSAASAACGSTSTRAYGGFAVLTERGRARSTGIELADSVTLDPHKWLYQPYECGCLLVRDGRALRRAFEIAPGLPARRGGRGAAR